MKFALQFWICFSQRPHRGVGGRASTRRGRAGAAVAMPQPKKRKGPSNNLGLHAHKRAASPPAAREAAGQPAPVLSCWTVHGSEGMRFYGSLAEADAAHRVQTEAAAEARAESACEAAEEVAAAARRDSTRLGQQPARRQSANEGELRAAAWPKSDRAAQRIVNTVLDFIAERAGTATHAATAICRLFAHKPVVIALQAAGMATDVHKAVYDGVCRKMRDVRDASLHLDVTGRLVYRGMLGAAVTGLDGVNHGLRQTYAAIIGLSPRSMYYAREREEILAKVGDVMLLDPRRAKRKDNLSAEKISAIQQWWKKSTKASPDKRPSVTLTLADGTEVRHGIHWQQSTAKEIFDGYCADPLSPVVGYTSFRNHKPYFIKKAGFRGCLCPKCHQMRHQVSSNATAAGCVPGAAEGCRQHS